MPKGKPPALILCPLSDWQKRVSTGPRAKGQVIEYRFVLQAAKYCWSLVCEYKNGTMIASKHSPSMEYLAPTFKTEAALDPVSVLTIVKDRLKQLTGRSFDLKIDNSKTGAALWTDLGKQLDDFFGLNYSTTEKDFRPALFGQAVGEDDED